MGFNNNNEPFKRRKTVVTKYKLLIGRDYVKTLRSTGDLAASYGRNMGCLQRSEAAVISTLDIKSITTLTYPV